MVIKQEFYKITKGQNLFIRLIKAELVENIAWRNSTSQDSNGEETK